MKQRRRRDLLIRLGLIVPVGISLLLALVNRLSRREVSDSFGWVRHTLEVEVILAQVRDLASDVRDVQGNLGPAADPSRVARYRRAVNLLPAALRRFSNLTADNPNQRARAAQLAGLLRGYDASLDSSLSRIAGDNGGPTPALGGPDRADNFDAVIEAAQGEERALLTGRERRLDSVLDRRETLATVVLAANLILLLVFLYLLSAFQQQKQMATVCAWSRVIQYEGEWITFEQYLGRRFDIDVSHGMSPAAAERLLREDAGPTPAKSG